MKRSLLIALSFLTMGVNTAFAGYAKVKSADAYQLSVDIMNNICIDFNFEVEMSNLNKDEASVFVVIDNKRWKESKNELVSFLSDANIDKMNIFKKVLPVIGGKCVKTIPFKVQLEMDLLSGGDNPTFYYKAYTMTTAGEIKEGIMMQFTPDFEALKQQMIGAGMEMVGGFISSMLGGWGSIPCEVAIRLYSSPCKPLATVSLVKTAEELLSSSYSGYTNIFRKYGVKNGELILSDRLKCNISVRKDNNTSDVGVVQYYNLYSNDVTIDDIINDLKKSGYDLLGYVTAKYPVDFIAHQAHRYVNKRKPYVAEIGYRNGELISIVFYKYSTDYNFVELAHELFKVNKFNGYLEVVDKVWDVDYGAGKISMEENWAEACTAPYYSTGSFRIGVQDTNKKDRDVMVVYFDKFVDMGKYTQNIESQLKSYKYTNRGVYNGNRKIYTGLYYVELKYDEKWKLSSITFYRKNPGLGGTSGNGSRKPTTGKQNGNSSTGKPNGNSSTGKPNGNSSIGSGSGNGSGKPNGNGPKRDPSSPYDKPNRDPSAVSRNRTGHNNATQSKCFNVVEVAEKLISEDYDRCNTIFSKYGIGICTHFNAKGDKRHKADGKMNLGEKLLGTSSFKCFQDGSFLKVEVYNKKRNGSKVDIVKFSGINNGTAEDNICTLFDDLNKAGYQNKGEGPSEVLVKKETKEKVTVKKYVNNKNNITVEMEYSEKGELKTIVFIRK